MPGPLDFIRQLQMGVGNDPLALRGDIAPDPMAVLHTMGAPQPPAALPENIPAPPGMFGMNGDRTDALAMGVQNYLQNLGQINPYGTRGDQAAEAFLRGLAGSLSGMRVAEMGARQQKARGNAKTNEDNQQDYRERSRTWGQQGFTLRRDAAERRAQAARDAEQQKFEAEQKKLDREARLKETQTRTAGNVRVEELRGDRAKGTTPKSAPKAAYVAPAPNSLRTRLRSLETQAGREYNKDKKNALLSERTRMIEQAIRDAYQNAPDASDPNAARYTREFRSFLNETGYQDKWRSVVGK